MKIKQNAAQRRVRKLLTKEDFDLICSAAQAVLDAAAVSGLGLQKQGSEVRDQGSTAGTGSRASTGTGRLS